MKITSKLESYEKIIELNLNRFPEKIFKKGEEKDILDFINTYPAEYYAIRDKSKAKGVFKLKVNKENILDEIIEYSLFSINVSSYNYKNNQKLVGEILISDDNVNAILSTTTTNRDRHLLLLQVLNSSPQAMLVAVQPLGHRRNGILMEMSSKAILQQAATTGML